MIPIILLHHNDFNFLTRTLSSLKKNTLHPHKIYVVDNNSNKNDLFWESLKKNYPNLNIIFNKKNNWVYGFNIAIKKLQTYPYYVLSDADIEFPKPINKVCWLSYLKSQLDNYYPIGKAGLPLDLDLIKNIKHLKNLYQRELSFKKGKMIGTNIIAPVDTTVAIYRNDLFMEDFFIRVGHFRNMKPHYYCVRVKEDYKCNHIGWEKYISYKDIQNIKDIKKKAKFFGRFAIMMEKDLLKRLPVISRLSYFLSFYFYRSIYSLKIVLNFTIYYLSLKILNDNKNKYYINKDVK